jgi:tetraacyldisaccharide 4'-kinase
VPLPGLTGLRGLRGLLEACWWHRRHAWVGIALSPLAALYGLLAGGRARAYGIGLLRAQRLPVPVVVVGNLVVGGAGKTPTTIALVKGLRACGWTPGVVSRGYGGAVRGPRAVVPDDDPQVCGDEPLLIRRRTGAPVWVGASRVAAGRRLCAAHPEVDLLVADDGLQHLQLARDVEVIVFDERGLGNGRLLPAGPLRQRPSASPPAGAIVVYNALRPSTPWPGHSVTRRLGPAIPLAQWWRGQSCTAPPPPWAGRDEALIAAAGIAEPERFFSMLEAAGARIVRFPLPDHAAWETVPWPAGTGPVLVTEKDAVKLPATHPDAARIHVVPLDFELPGEALAAVCARLPARAVAEG